MISFAEGWSSKSSIKEDLKQMIADILINKDKLYKVGSSHGGLHPTQVQDIIAYLMFQEENSSVQFTVSNEVDGYHLTLTIDKKQKKS